MSIRQKYQQLVELLLPVFGSREAASQARIVFEDAFAIHLLQDERPFPESHARVFDEIAARLVKGEPVQYVLGQCRFLELDLMISPAVLIPRPETEELVHWMIEDLEGRGRLQLLDIGTGSGCIALSLKKHLPAVQVSAIDISMAALAIARQNAQRHQCEVQFLQLDVLDETKWPAIAEMDVIVSNPPYIAQAEHELLPEQVLRYEPAEALFVEQDDPLLFYKRIAELARRKLARGGALYFETSEFNAKQVVAHLEEQRFERIMLRKDMQGKDRMIRANRI